jgi:hypothetical protein
MSPSRAHQNRQRPRLTATEVDLEWRQQRALLVGTGYGTTSIEEAEASLDELVLLTETAGAEADALQRRSVPDPATTSARARPRSCGSSAKRSTSTRHSTTSSRPLSSATEKIFKVDVRPFADPRHLRPARAESEGMIQVELAQPAIGCRARAVARS